MRTCPSSLAPFVSCLLVAACSPRFGNPPTAPALVPTVSASFDKDALAVAAEYRSYTRVSVGPKLSPTLCVAPPVAPGLSTSTDAGTHGRKVYFLFAWDADAYRAIGRGTTESPIGQTVVKEAFGAVEAPGGQSVGPGLSRPDGDVWVSTRAVDEHGRAFRPGDPAGLFMMFKLDPSTPGTDRGWVYAVTTADAKTVIAAGDIASCRGCHEQTDRDRLYGHPDSWPRDAKGRVDWSAAPASPR